jgi:hypothetical protein
MFFTPGSHSSIVSYMEDHVTFKASRSARGRHIVAAAVVAALGCFASPAWATCTGTATLVCSDSTSVEAYKGTTFQSGYTGNGFVGGVGNALQSSGHSFDTDKLVATLTQGRTSTFLELKFYTSFDGNDLGARYADIFLGSGKTDTFGYAVSLGDQGASGANNGGVAAGFYKVSSEKTSQDIWQSKGGTYGGRYLGLDGTTWYKSATVLTGGTQTTQTQLFTETATETTTSADGSFGYLVDMKLSAKTTDFIALFGSGLSIFWGTADCSNDPIEAFIPYAPTPHIPEPMTLSLFGAGLAGAAAIRRRRKPKAA